MSWAELKKAASPVGKRTSLGAPPPPEAASNNLSQPETAPAPLHEPAQAREAVSASTPAKMPEAASGQRKGSAYKRDLRSLNATGRLIQFSTRIDMETNDRIRDYCERQKARRRQRDPFGACHFLEAAIDALESLEKQDG